MTLPDANLPARLFRSRADWPEEVSLHPMEEIGQGSLFRMVRIALSDPDEAIWAYAITAADRSYKGREILTLRALADRSG
jgi:hypothetical protein